MVLALQYRLDLPQYQYQHNTLTKMTPTQKRFHIVTSTLLSLSGLFNSIRTTCSTLAEKTLPLYLGLEREVLQTRVRAPKVFLFSQLLLPQAYFPPFLKHFLKFYQKYNSGDNLLYQNSTINRTHFGDLSLISSRLINNSIPHMSSFFNYVLGPERIVSSKHEAIINLVKNSNNSNSPGFVLLPHHLSSLTNNPNDDNNVEVKVSSRLLVLITTTTLIFATIYFPLSNPILDQISNPTHPTHHQNKKSLNEQLIHNTYTPFNSLLSNYSKSTSPSLLQHSLHINTMNTYSLLQLYNKQHQSTPNTPLETLFFDKHQQPSELTGVMTEFTSLRGQSRLSLLSIGSSLGRNNDLRTAYVNRTQNDQNSGGNLSPPNNHILTLDRYNMFSDTFISSNLFKTWSNAVSYVYTLVSGSSNNGQNAQTLVTGDEEFPTSEPTIENRTDKSKGENNSMLSRIFGSSLTKDSKGPVTKSKPLQKPKPVGVKPSFGRKLRHEAITYVPKSIATQPSSPQNILETISPKTTQRKTELPFFSPTYHNTVLQYPHRIITNINHTLIPGLTKHSLQTIIDSSSLTTPIDYSSVYNSEYTIPNQEFNDVIDFHSSLSKPHKNTKFRLFTQSNNRNRGTNGIEVLPLKTFIMYMRRCIAIARVNSRKNEALAQNSSLQKLDPRPLHRQPLRFTAYLCQLGRDLDSRNIPVSTLTKYQINDVCKAANVGNLQNIPRRFIDYSFNSLNLASTNQLVVDCSSNSRTTNNFNDITQIDPIDISNMIKLNNAATGENPRFIPPRPYSYAPEEITNLVGLTGGFNPKDSQTAQAMKLTNDLFSFYTSIAISGGLGMNTESFFLTPNIPGLNTSNNDEKIQINPQNLLQNAQMEKIKAQIKQQHLLNSLNSLYRTSNITMRIVHEFPIENISKIEINEKKIILVMNLPPSRLENVGKIASELNSQCLQLHQFESDHVPHWFTTSTSWNVKMQYAEIETNSTGINRGTTSSGGNNNSNTSQSNSNNLNSNNTPNNPHNPNITNKNQNNPQNVSKQTPFDMNVTIQIEIHMDLDTDSLERIAQAILVVKQAGGIL
jgi:hypothetical protein